MAEKKPISSGFIARALAGLKYTFTGQSPDGWFGPMEPLDPIAPEKEVAGRQWDYPTGANLQYVPRSTEAISFNMMRSLADNYDLLRLVIETRKDQIVKMDWDIKGVEGTDLSENDSRPGEIKKRLKFPDDEHSWQSWLRMILEDMLVIDAATIYPRRTVGGSIFTLEPIDGATIKRLIDITGRTPAPPAAAYQQILKGIVASDYTADELIYYPRNPRTHKFYGYSPVEQIIMTVNIALRRQMFQLGYYTEGNMPDALISVPPEWNPDTIKQFQEYWDTLLSGNLEERRKTKFIPGGMAPNMFKEPLLKDEMDEWLARIVCFAFSISPTPFVKQMNRATAQTVQEAALNEGLVPLLRWVKDLLDLVIWKYWRYEDLEFAWQMAEEVDPATRAQIHDVYIRNGTLSVDEVREELGREPIGLENAVYGAQGVTLVKDIINPPEPPPALQLPAPAPEPGNEPVPAEPAAAKKLMAEFVNKAYKAGLL